MHKSLYSRGNKVLLQLLAESRAQVGMTQIELAKKLKQDQSWVSKVERGIRRLDLVELALWCKALGIPLSQFVARYEDRLGLALEQAQAKSHK
jgi:transcriptional regulator with XRE-family HTH domain